MMIPYDPADEREHQKAEAVAEAVARRALRLGGTCTGEHGIGLHRCGLLAEEHGPAVALMREIKRSLDPRGIMNPGKMIASDAPLP